MYKSSFDPIIGKSPQVLILGSLPGDKSIELQEYYGHPQNRFWKLMNILLDIDISVPYDLKKDALIRKKIAVWDTAHTAFRPGSMDSSMAKEIPNNIEELLQANPTIKSVCFNGQKAAALFKKFFTEHTGICYHTLPSTSPANAGCNMKCLEDAWKVIKQN